MKGTRPLTIEEIGLVKEAFEGKYAVRNRSLFMIGVSTGGRISELLSLRIGDVYQNGNPVSQLLFLKSIVKGQENARAVPVNADGRRAISELIEWHEESFGCLDADRPLFPSRKSGSGIVAIRRQQAHRIFKTACDKASLNGKLATHSLRKSYAQRLYGLLSDIFCIKELLGHKNVVTTQAYLGVDYDKVKQASEAMSLDKHLKSKLENETRQRSVSDE